MASLSHNFNMSSGAQTFGNAMEADAAIVSERQVGADGQQLLSDPVLSSDNDGAFKPLKTIPAFSIHLLISTIISFAGVMMAAIWPAEQRCKAYFIMLYLRATFWLITLLFDHLVKHHHDNLRLNGYHEFHKSTAMQKSLSFYIVSLWNSMLLGVAALMHHFYGDNFWQHCIAEGFLSPIAYVTAFNIAETLVLTATHSSYIAKVLKFNKAKPLPDAMRGANNTSGSLGLMQPGGNTAELLEKQADLIAYLKDHNLKLNQKLHQMQLNARTVNISA